MLSESYFVIGPEPGIGITWWMLESSTWGLCKSQFIHQLLFWAPTVYLSLHLALHRIIVTYMNIDYVLSTELNTSHV